MEIGTMSVITRRLSLVELSQSILEMAKTGVYRESVFEALRPVATKKQISLAIAHAKQFGLHSVADLRDTELGTYYQLDLVKYQSLQQAIHTTIPLDQDDDLVKRVMDARLTIKIMLTISGGLAIALMGFTGFCIFTDRPQAGLEAFISAISATGIWALQKAFARKTI